MPSGFASHWTLDPAITYLNHGAFGACPRVVQQAQSALRARIERNPVGFFWRDLEALQDEARAALARFVGGAAADLAFVGNTTAGVNAVLRSLVLAPGDELLLTSHAYNACRVTAEHVAARAGARVVVATLPFLGATPDRIVDAVMAAVSPRTRLALVEHVTSPTALVLPVAALVGALDARGVDTLVDGAHAPGMVALNLAELKPAYYVGHCHKWLCAPKGAAFIAVRPDRQAGLFPVSISHGANSTRQDRSRFHLLFDWTGGFDPSGWLSVPVALQFMAGLLPGGWPALRAHNHALALDARGLLAETLAVRDPLPPVEMIGSFACVPLPPPAAGPRLTGHGRLDPLQTALSDAGFEVSIVNWPGCGRLLRICAQIYNDADDYVRLAAALRPLLERGI